MAVTKLSNTTILHKILANASDNGIHNKCMYTKAIFISTHATPFFKDHLLEQMMRPNTLKEYVDYQW